MLHMSLDNLDGGRGQPEGCKSPYCEPPWCKNCGRSKDAIDAARWRAFVRSTGHETDMSTGPGKHKDMHIRLNCTGCERYTESGAPDWKGTLEAVMDDEIRLQATRLTHSASEKHG